MIGGTLALVYAAATGVGLAPTAPLSGWAYGRWLSIWLGTLLVATGLLVIAVGVDFHAP